MAGHLDIHQVSRLRMMPVSSEVIWTVCVEFTSMLRTLSINVLPLPQTVTAAISIQPSGKLKKFCKEHRTCLVVRGVLAIEARQDHKKPHPIKPESNLKPESETRQHTGQVRSTRDFFSNSGTRETVEEPN
jgi:hypothetical protein